MDKRAKPVTYYKFGPEPENTDAHWYEFLYDGNTGAKIDANVVILHFVDGQRGDDDLESDGRIVDQGGPGFIHRISLPWLNLLLN